MERLNNFMKFGIDLLAAIFLASIVAFLTPLIIDQHSNINYTFVYIWLASLILILLLSWKIFQTDKNRFFLKRFKNEEEASPTIANLSKISNSKLCILSKVGSSIFVNFEDYTSALEKGRVVQVLVADPDDNQLIELMNRIYVQQTPVSKSWISMVSELRSRLEHLNESSPLPNEMYKQVRALLDSNIDGSHGYETLIKASVLMWSIAQQVANQNLARSGSTFQTHGLEIRAYNVLPDIKAWIFDEGCCVLGTYDALHLGRNNPMDLYQPGKNNGVEHWQFQNVLKIWEYKFSKSRRINLNTNPEIAL